MKRIPLLIILVATITLTSCSKKNSDRDGFLGIAWGTPKAEATKMMLDRQGVKLSEMNYGDSTAVFFDGAMDNGRHLGMLNLWFNHAGLCQGTYGITWSATSSRQLLFDSLHTELVKKLGTPVQDTAGQFFTLWSLPTENKPADTVALLAAETGFVFVTYRNGEQFKQKRAETPNAH